MERGAKWRPSVMAFADLMEARLCQKDAERGGDSWKDRTTMPALFATTIASRAQMLKIATFQTQTGPRMDGRYAGREIDDVRKLAPDIANYAMMLLDVMGELPQRQVPDDGLEPEFDIVDADDGMSRFVTLPAYRRNNNSIYLRLMLTSALVSEGTVASWTDEQAREADLWAVSVHASASDHDDIIVPATPAHVPLLAPGMAAHVDIARSITGEPC